MQQLHKPQLWLNMCLQPLPLNMPRRESERERERERKREFTDHGVHTLSVKIGVDGKRHRNCAEVVEDTSEQPFADFPIDRPPHHNLAHVGDSWMQAPHQRFVTHVGCQRAALIKKIGVDMNTRCSQRPSSCQEHTIASIVPIWLYRTGVSDLATARRCIFRGSTSSVFRRCQTFPRHQ